MLVQNDQIKICFGGGSTFQKNPNNGLGPKNCTIFSPYANFMLDAGVEFLSWPKGTEKWVKKAYRHMVVGPDFTNLEDNKIDFLWLSHSHIDHVAATPLLEQYFRNANSKIYASPHTLEIMKKVLMDTLRRSPYLYQPINGVLGVIDSLERGESMELGRKEMVPGIILHTGIAGHILGAMYGVFEIKKGPTLLDTGDIAFFKQPLVPGSTLIDDLQSGKVPLPNIIVGTDFTNPSLEEFDWNGAKEKLIATTTANLEQGLTTVYGAFENSRTQNVAEVLREANIGPIYVDGGGRHIYDVYQRNSSWSPLYPEVHLEGINYVTTADHRQNLIDDKTPKVIITTSGMFDGGPIESYLDAGLSDPRYAFIATSYVAPNSKAAALLNAMKEETPKLRLEDGSVVDIKAKVERINCTAHGNLLDFQRIVQTIHGKNGRRKITVFMTHGTKKTKKIAKELIRDYADCIMVEHGDTYDLNDFQYRAN